MTPDELRHLWVSPPRGLVWLWRSLQLGQAGDASLEQFGRCSSTQKSEFILLALSLLHLLFPEHRNCLAGSRKHRDVLGLLAGQGEGGNPALTWCLLQPHRWEIIPAWRGFLLSFQVLPPFPRLFLSPAMPRLNNSPKNSGWANKFGIIAEGSQAILSQSTAQLLLNYLSARNYLPGPAREEKLLPNLCLMNGLAGGNSGC